MSVESKQVVIDRTQEMLEKARKEVEACRTSSIINQSIVFADNVIKRLISLTLKKDIDYIFPYYVKERGSFLVTVKNKKTGEMSKYSMGLDIVDRDYMLDLGDLKNTEITNGMIFLLNTVKGLYCTVKDYMQEWVKTDQMKPLSDKSKKKFKKNKFDYVLQIGLNTTLFLDENSDKRIGIVFNPC